MLFALDIVCLSAMVSIRRLWFVLILLFCVYVLLRALFHSFVIIRLQAGSHLHMRLTSYLASHQMV